MEQKQVVAIARDQEIIFTNWTDEMFVGQWNKREYKIEAGKSYYLPFYLAEHFAKHLVDRELYKISAQEIEKELSGSRLSYDDRKRAENRIEERVLKNATLRQELIDKCVNVTDVHPDFVQSHEVPMREVVLNRDKRNEKLIEEGIEVPRTMPRKNKQVEDVDDFEGSK